MGVSVGQPGALWYGQKTKSESKSQCVCNREHLISVISICQGEVHLCFAFHKIKQGL